MYGDAGLGHYHGMNDWLRHEQVQEADRKASRAGARVRELEVAVDRLALATEAMWELLRDHTGLGDTELIAKIKEVDLRDGKLDGRSGRPVRTCRECDRPNASRRRACMYCGVPLESPSAF